MRAYLTLNEDIIRRRQEADARLRAAFASPAASGPGSAFALGAAGGAGDGQQAGGALLEPPGLRLLRMSSLHALGARVRGSTGSAAADAAHLVPGLAAGAIASAASAAAGLRAAGLQAAPLDLSTHPSSFNTHTHQHIRVHFFKVHTHSCPDYFF